MRVWLGVLPTPLKMVGHDNGQENILRQLSLKTFYEVSSHFGASFLQIKQIEI